MPKLVSVADAAEFLDLTEAEVFALIGSGELETTIELERVIDLTAGNGAEDGAAVSRLRISSSVLSAYRQTRHSRAS